MSVVANIYGEKILPFEGGSRGAAQNSGTTDNVINVSCSPGTIEIYNTFSFVCSASITIKPNEFDIDGNPTYINPKPDETIISVKCVDITMPDRPRFLNHVNISNSVFSSTVSGFYDMMPTGVIKAVPESKTNITDVSTFVNYDITEAPARPKSQIFYWTNDLSYSFNYIFNITTNYGIVRSRTFSQTIVQDWTRIRDVIADYYSNDDPVIFAANSAYSLQDIYGA